jgi:hypothetical protein
MSHARRREQRDDLMTPEPRPAEEHGEHDEENEPA